MKALDVKAAARPLHGYIRIIDIAPGLRVLSLLEKMMNKE
jgi:hypothetical protein